MNPKVSILQKEYVFELTTRRMVFFLLRPVIILLAIPALFYYKVTISQSWNLIDISLFGILFLYILIPTIILFTNHSKYSRDIKVSVEKSKIYIYNKNKEYIATIDSVNSITETSPYGYELPWSDIRFWTISADGKEFKVSSLILPKSKMDYYFWNKILNRYKTFPLIDGYS